MHGNPMTMYSDATLGGPVEAQCRATSGIALFHLYMLISWLSKLQPFTCASSHNAELVALALAADETMWARKTVEELYFCYPTLLLSDNTHPMTIMDVTEDEGIVDGIAQIDLALADGSTSREDHATQALEQHTKTASAPWYDN